MPERAWLGRSHGEPTDQITVKSANSLGGGHSQTWGQIIVPIVAITVGVSTYVYTQYFMEGDDAVAE